MTLLPESSVFGAQCFCAEIGTDRSYTPGEPIAKDSTRSKGGAVRPNSGLTIEGQDLLIALKRFAESHMCSPTGEQTEQQLLGNLDQLEGVSSQCGSPAIDSDNLYVVESDSSRYVQPIDGWDAHMWKSSDFDLIIAGGPLDSHRTMCTVVLMYHLRRCRAI